MIFLEILTIVLLVASVIFFRISKLNTKADTLGKNHIKDENELNARKTRHMAVASFLLSVALGIIIFFNTQ